MEAAHYRPYARDTLLVAVSVSGEGARTVAAAEAARSAGARTLALTANPESTLGRLAAARLVLAFKARSRATPHTTDFLTTLLAVAALVESLAGRRLAVLDGLPALAAQVVPALEKPCRDLGRELAGCERYLFLGAGPSFGVAQYAAEKLWEAGGIEAHACELEEFAHGAHFLVTAGDPVVVIAPPGRSSGKAAVIAEGLHELGARPVELDVPGAADLPEEWSPFATAVAVQWLCHAIATEKGYDVVRKDGRHADPGAYARAHVAWTAMPARTAP
jgi:glucosamine--fructose-6-phosphate aminotransferase (isomerizing)